MPSTTRSFALAFLAYVVPSFVVAILWHLVAFADVYDRLAIYRPDVLVPVGLMTMLLQGLIFASWYPRFRGTGGVVAEGMRFAAVAGTLAWTYTTLAVAAKFPMTSIGGYVLIETGFNAVQWSIVGPLIALAYGAPGSRPPGSEQPGSEPRA